jgi:hypothetical protein
VTSRALLQMRKLRLNPFEGDFEYLTNLQLHGKCVGFEMSNLLDWYQMEAKASGAHEATDGEKTEFILSWK